VASASSGEAVEVVAIEEGSEEGHGPGGRTVAIPFRVAEMEESWREFMFWRKEVSALGAVLGIAGLGRG